MSAGIDAHDALMEKTVAKALHDLARALLSDDSKYRQYLSPLSTESASGSSADIAHTGVPSLMGVNARQWVLEELPADLSFCLTPGQANPTLPKIAILGLQKFYAELVPLEGSQKAKEFLTAFYTKTTQADDGWVSFSVEDKVYQLSLLDIFSLVSLATEDLQTESTDALAAEVGAPATATPGAGAGAGAGAGMHTGFGAGAGAGAGFGLSPETFAGTVSDAVAVAVAVAVAGSGSSSSITALPESAENPWKKLARYLCLDVGINIACSTLYRDLMMIGLRHLGHAEAGRIFPGIVPLIREALLECFNQLRPKFEPASEKAKSENAEYAKFLYLLLSEGEGSEWIKILSALVDNQVKDGRITLLGTTSHFSFRTYFVNQFFPDFLRKHGLDLTSLETSGSSLPRHIQDRLASQFPDNSDPPILDGLRWTNSPKDPGYFLESLVSQVGSNSPCAGVLLGELSKLNAEQAKATPYHRDLGRHLAEIDRLAEQLLSLHQRRKALNDGGYSNPENHAVFDESAKKFTDDTAPLFTDRDESLRIKEIPDLERLLSSISEHEKATKALLDEHASSSHAAISNVFALLFHQHPLPLADRLRYLHQNVLSRPSPVNQSWLEKYLENRECFAKEVNQLVLYALTHPIPEWSPTLFECLSRTLMTFSKMDSLENYALSLGLGLETLDDSRKRELENQIDFVKHSYPNEFQDLLKGLVADYQRLHPTTDAAEATVAMAGAGDPAMAAPTVAPPESQPLPLGLHRLYEALSPDFFETLSDLKLAEVSAEEIFSFVKANLAKIRDSIENGAQLAAVITALGGKDISLQTARKLFTKTVLAKIQDGYDLAKVIGQLGGKDMKPAIAVLLLIETVLAKIQNGYDLAKVIRRLGGKDMADGHEALLLTREFLAKIENGYELAHVIRELGGKDISLETARKLFTDSVLAKIENGFQLEAVIHALGGKDMKPAIAKLLFTTSIVERFPEHAHIFSRLLDTVRPDTTSGTLPLFTARTGPSGGTGTGPSEEAGGSIT